MYCCRIGFSRKNFFLAADIDFAGRVFQDAPIAPNTVPSSWGSHYQGTTFSGVFDGGGHIIRNLTISVSDKNYVGLFGIIANPGKVQRLGLENVNVAGTSYVGGLVGALNGGDVSECYVTGAVSCMAGEMYLGGVAGIGGGGFSISKMVACPRLEDLPGVNPVPGNRCCPRCFSLTKLARIPSVRRKSGWETVQVYPYFAG